MSIFGSVGVIVELEVFSGLLLSPKCAPNNAR